MKKQRRLQEISLFSAPACALIRTYPDDARQRDWGRPGASVGATNPGSVALTVHRHENKITTPRPCQDTRNQDLRRTSMLIKKAKTKTEKHPLPGRRTWQGQGLPRKKAFKTSRQGLPGLTRAKTPHQAISPRPTSLINAVSSRKVTKWQPFATWQPLSTGNTYR
jgi:hypothetical protein